MGHRILLQRIVSRRGLAVTAAMLVILFLTLLPSGSEPPLPFSYELGGERRWLADGILNLLLFVPLGLAIGWNSRSPWIAILSGLLLSTAVEMAQTVIPGRDPALSDIVFNTLGAAVGALLARRPHAWLRPDPKRSPTLASIAVVAAGAVMTATVLLLSPQGTATAARSGNDLLLRYPTRAAALGLDEPEYWFRDAFEPRKDAASGSIVVRPERNYWRVSIGSSEQAALGPTVGEGWTLLAYPNAIARRWGWVANGLWMFALCIPIGFWARGRRHLIAAGGGVVALLAFIPAITGVATTSPTEWVGAAAGLFCGISLALGMSSGVATRQQLLRRVGYSPAEIPPPDGSG